jgi:hypothetical protein
MNDFTYLIAGVCAVTAYLVAKKQQGSAKEPVEVLVDESQEAESEHRPSA